MNIQVLSLSLMVFIGAQVHGAQGSSSKKSLTEQLRERAESSAQKTPKAKKKIMMAALESLKTSSILKSAKKVGDSAPSFRLQDFQKGVVDSKALIEKGPLVVVFYRGGWCPYCNLQLRDLQVHLEDIKNRGAQLVAISPELPDRSKATAQKQNLDFYVLSDPDGTVGKAFGLMYAIPKELNDLYLEFGIDLKAANGNSKRELPLAATYVINKKGKVTFAFLDTDYKRRAETKDVIQALDLILYGLRPPLRC